MKNIFIIHGLGGHPQENWFPWFKKELEREGNSIIVPQFPHPFEPQLSEWLEHFEQYREQISKNTILVGHSLGVTFILRFLERTDIRVDSCFLVAGAIEPMGNDFDPLVANFFKDPYDWKTIRSRSNFFSVFHANNDPYIPLTQAQKITRELHADFHLIPGGGHLNEGVGYLKFPLLLQEIERRLIG